MGENFFRKIIDDKVEGLDAKKLAGAEIGKKIVLGIGSVMAMNILQNTEVWKTTEAAITGFIINPVGSVNAGKFTETFKIVVGIAGGAVATYIAYKIISDLIKSCDEDGCDLEEALEHEFVGNPAIATTI